MGTDQRPDLLPGGKGHVGVTAKDNRRFVEAVLDRYRAGIPWRFLPERFGDWKNAHRRLSRCDPELYKARHMIESFFCKLEQFRAVATR